MKLTFIGVGSAFALKNLNSNMLLETTHERQHIRGDVVEKTETVYHRMLIDCGFTAQQGLKDVGLTAKDIDALYISHQHADHIGGMEWFGFTRYFGSAGHMRGLPELYVNEKLASSLWNDSLRGGMRSHEGVVLELDSFFKKVHRLRKNKSFEWQGTWFQPVQTIHVMDGYEVVPSYGLMVKTKIQNTESYREAFITTDTQFCPRQIEAFYKRAWIIFQDCEAAPYRSGVHAHYDDLRTLDAEVKAKMWLYHYPDAVNDDDTWAKRAKADGFAGFVAKGQSFEL